MLSKPGLNRIQFANGATDKESTFGSGIGDIFIIGHQYWSNRKREREEIGGGVGGEGYGVWKREYGMKSDG